MKTLKICMLLLFATGIVSAQDLNPSELPHMVSDAFNENYAQATDVEWERDMENYKVEFDIGRMEHEIWYDASGAIVKMEHDIAEADLPQAIQDVIKSKYPGYKIDDLEMNWQNDATTYKVELEKGNEDWEIVFDAMGNIHQERRD